MSRGSISSHCAELTEEDPSPQKIEVVEVLSVTVREVAGPFSRSRESTMGTVEERALARVFEELLKKVTVVSVPRHAPPGMLKMIVASARCDGQEKSGVFIETS